MKVLVITAFLLALVSGSALADTGNPAFAAPEDVATVEVLGTLRGAGSLVLVDGKPRILTNSHVVQNRKDNSVTLPPRDTTWKSDWSWDDRLNPRWRKPLTFSTVVEFNSAISDIAILAPGPEVDPKLLELLKSYAQSNVSFCDPSSPQCKEGFKVANASVLSPTRISTATSGTVEKSDVLFPYKPTSVPDNYLTGVLGRAIKIPAMARPGMSGGALYQAQQFSGMLTKIEMGGAGEAYAIPVDQIAKVIAPSYFGTKPEIDLPVSRWEARGNGYLLTVEEGGHTVSMSAATGTIRNVGGETGNGGGETGNGGAGRISGRFWTLEYKDALGLHKKSLVNPFSLDSKGSGLTIDGQTVSYFLVTDKNGKDSRILAPTLAHYLWLKRNPEYSSRIVFTQDSETALSNARRSFSQKLNFLRIYEENGNGELRLLTDRGLTDLAAGAVRLERSACRGADENESLASTMRSLMEFANPVALKEDSDATVNLSIHPRFLSLRDPSGSPEELQIRIPKNLSQIEVRSGSARQSEFLKPTVHGSSLSVPYKSDNVQAVAIFDDKNMARLDRVLIKSGKLVIEAISCEIGKECFR